MMNLQKIKAMKRIKEEFEELNQNPLSNIGVTVGLPKEDNIFEWQCTLSGPNDSSYKGGLFILTITFPENYPESKPEVCFKTPIYHINVNPKKKKDEKSEGLGHVCISTLNWWKSEYKIKDILTSIFALFYNANPESPYGLDRADEFRDNRAVYEEKVKYFTKKFANPSKFGIEYTDDWDFSFP